MKKIYLLSLALFLFSCAGEKQEVQTEVPQEVDVYTHHSESIKKVFEAHGGFDTWTNLKQLSYENGGSKTLVDLQRRYTRIESEAQTVGFDGKQVWVYPASENAERQRMRYNLIFYFYAFPFVVGDPGIIYEDLDQVEIKAKTYNAVKVSYNDGVGDSPNDNYIICSNPETNQMEWLMYTATFGSEETSDRYSLIKYEGWENFEGVYLPSSLQWYQYANGKVGEPRGNPRTFTNIQVSKEYPAMNNFEVPEGAAIAADPTE